MDFTQRLACAGTENAITIAEILFKHGSLDADDVAALRGSLNNIDLIGMPDELHRWKSGQIDRVSHLARRLSQPEG